MRVVFVFCVHVSLCLTLPLFLPKHTHSLPQTNKKTKQKENKHCQNTKTNKQKQEQKTGRDKQRRGRHQPKGGRERRHHHSTGREKAAPINGRCFLFSPCVWCSFPGSLLGWRCLSPSPLGWCLPPLPKNCGPFLPSTGCFPASKRKPG